MRTRVLPVRRTNALAIVLYVLVGIGLAGTTPAETLPAEKSGGIHDQLLEECGRPDPFAPLMRRPLSQPEDHEERGDQLHLGGFIWSKNHPQAIINDALVSLGDKVAGRTVVGIECDQVVLEINGKKEILKFETP